MIIVNQIKASLYQRSDNKDTGYKMQCYGIVP